MTTPLDITPGQWLRNSILERYPLLLQESHPFSATGQRAADLNHDGTIAKTEVFQGDVKNIDDVTAYYARNKAIIDQHVPFARWATSMDGEQFYVRNPLFDYAHLSLKTVPHEDVKNTLGLAKIIIDDYRVFGNPHASTEEAIDAIYQRLYDEGIAIGGTAVISEGLARGTMSRDAAAILVMGIAYQLGFDVYSAPNPEPAEDPDDAFCNFIGISPCPFSTLMTTPPAAGATLHYVDGTTSEVGLEWLFGSFYTAHAVMEGNRGTLGRARELYRTAIDIDQGNLSLHYRLGDVLRKMGRYDEAIGLYTEILARHPDALDARINRGLTRLEKKDFAGAEEEFRGVIRAHPDNAPAYLHLAKVLHVLDKKGEAIAMCKKAMALNPHYGAAHLRLGRMVHERGKRRAALGHYKKAHRLDGSLSDALYYQGIVYREWGKRGAARYYFNRAIRNDRGNAKAMYFNALGLYEQRRKNYTKAEWYFTQATRRDPKYAKGFANRADVRNFYLRKYFAARKDYQRALTIDPVLMYARVNLGFLLLHLKEPQEALIHSSRAIAIKPGYCEAHFLHGQVLFAHHKKKITSVTKPLLASLSAFEKAITCSSKRVNSEYFFWRARAWFAKGNLKEALHDLDKAIRIDPKYAEAFLLRSEVKKAKSDGWGAARDRTEGCSIKPSLCPMQFPSRTLPPSPTPPSSSN